MNPQKFSCAFCRENMCRKVISTCIKTGMRKHTISYVGQVENKQWYCDICSKSFRNAEAINEHKSYMHSKTMQRKKEYNWLCSVCGKVLESGKFCLQNYLNQH